ncbi:MAG: DUF4340 domain-containing protein [Planctomycetota bacterium]
MIKSKMIFVLLTVCVLLFLGNILIKEDRPTVRAPEKIGDRLLSDFNSDVVTSIDIKKSGVAVTLVKKDKQWTLSSHKNRLAKIERINTLFNDIAYAAIEDTRSGSPDGFSLDDQNCASVVFQRETGKTEIFIGKSPDFGKAFARVVKDGPIYEINKGLDTSIGIRTENDKRVLDPTYFYDLKILGLNSEDILDIAIKKGHETVRLQLTIPGKGPVEAKQELPKDCPKPIWWLTEPEGLAAEESVVNLITSAVRDLTAQSYADNISRKDAGLETPTAQVRLRLKDGADYTLSFGKIDGDSVMLSVSGKTDLYKVFKYTYDNMVKSATELKKKETPTTPPSANETTINPPPPPPNMNVNDNPTSLPPVVKSDAPPPPPRGKAEEKPTPPVPKN